MPRKSVQHIKRKQRLSGKDLTTLARKKVRNSLAAYQYGTGDSQIGWYLLNPSENNHIFIGSNWLIARDYISQMPTTYTRPVTTLRGFFARLRGGVT